MVLFVGFFLMLWRERAGTQCVAQADPELLLARTGLELSVNPPVLAGVLVTGGQHPPWLVCQRLAQVCLT